MHRTVARCAALALAAALAAGCSWRQPGEANAVAPVPSGVPQPRAGLSLSEVIAVAETEEEGEFSADAEIVRVTRVADGHWEDVSTRAARKPGFPLAAGADYVVVARRTCTDWATTRDRWSDERASWFLLTDGKLAAYDHWTFGARCGVANEFRPVADDSPSRATERDLLRWLEQRHPSGPIPTELRFSRGRAYAAAGRIEEARAMLRFGDDALDAREDLFEARIVTEEESAAFETEGRRLRDLRADLSADIRAAEARAAKR
jgi:hypothetical protein